MIAFFNGRFQEKAEIAISPDDRGFLFADGVYEVIRSYDGNLFQLEAHLERLAYGLDQLRIGGVDLAELGRVTSRLLQENHLRAGDATVYLQITRGSAPRTHYFPPPETPPTVYVAARPLPGNTEMQERGVKAILVPDQRWARCDIKTTGLLANALASQRAKELDAFEALFVRDGEVLEGSRTNLFLVKQGTLLTAPRSHFILSGVTRQFVLNQAAALSIPCCERPVRAAELAEAAEVFLAGTTVEVTPVVRIDDQAVGAGEPGSITRRLLHRMRQLTR